MELLWQMDEVGRIHLLDGIELHAITGIEQRTLQMRARHAAGTP
jgi:hypothetical protein